MRDPRLWYAPWLFPGAHASMAGLATSGTLTRWFRDQLAPGAELRRSSSARPQASPKGAKGLLCLPYFSGERTPIHDPRAKGVFFGLDLTHTRGDLFRAVLEGIAAGTAHVLETYRELDAAPRTVYRGGWRDAERGLDAGHLGPRPGAAGRPRADASVPATATPSWPRSRWGPPTPTRIAAWNPVARTVMPERVPAYERQYPLWKALYTETREHRARAGRRPT